ncbi:MAG TPA: sulfatase [Candidatus Omnitrophota bacterium]|nr:sulfatase [Candidatus Omnitrophota bacterium]
MLKNFKKAAVLFCISFLIAEAFQVTCSVREVLANRYIQYGMPRLIAFVFQKNLNQAAKWSLALFFAVLFLYGIFFLILKITKSVASQKNTLIPFSAEKTEKGLFFVSTFFALFVGIGWATNHYWLPGKFHPISLLGDFGILIATLFSAWGLSKDLSQKNNKALLIAGTFALTLILGLNAAIYADTRLNSPKGPNVILISIDTLRDDALGINGCKIKDISPNIDRFARESINFKSCIAQAPWTLPSHVTMLTSLYPETHKVTDEGKKISPAIITLAELMRNQNYYTGAITDGGNLDPSYGFSQGFVSYDASCDYLKKKFPKLEKWLRENQKRKFFLFFHTYELHAPFVHTDYLNLLLKQKKINEEQISALNDFVSSRRPDLLAMGDKMKSLGLFNKESCRFLYLGGIHFVDQYFKKLLVLLEELNLPNQTVILFTSDHGEVFGEHDKNKFYHFHWAGLFQEHIKVPLLIRLPNASPDHNLQVTDPTGSIDIMPTILAYLGITSPSKMAGRNLLEGLKDSSSLKKNRAIFSSVGPEIKTIISGGLKYIQNPKNSPGFIAPHNAGLYDLNADPGEQNNLADRFPEECERMRLKLEKFTYWAENFLDVKPEEAELKEELKEQLRALGYLQ